jgi:hypothetical protein
LVATGYLHGHPDVPKPIVNAKEVRQFGVRYNTGSTDSLIEKECKLLFRWAVFANVVDERRPYELLSPYWYDGIYLR